MKNLSKTLGALIIASAVTIAGCGKSEDSKQYLTLRKSLPYCAEHYTVNPMEVSVFSPAKDQSGAAIRLYAIVNEKELKDIGLNPENMCKFDRDSWRKFLNGRSE